ncbi:MAG: hypothetical protein KDA99_02865 [Planctomycetales bacterium]|nr:hypothetical protein [Planctomycetales bacterium]
MVKFVDQLCLYCAGLTLLVTFAADARSAPRADQLWPSTTKGYVSVPDISGLEASWNRTQLGQLVADPAMKPFVEDLREQMKAKMDQTGDRLGVTIDDLRSVCSGEVSFAAIEPSSGTQKHAMAVMADTTGHDQERVALLSKIDAAMHDRLAVSKQTKMGDTAVTTYSVPVKKGSRKTFDVVIFVHDDVLVAIDSDRVAQDILERWGKSDVASLATLPAYRAVMERCAGEAGELASQLTWFVEPIGYSFVAREAAGGRKRRGPDILKALANQGFDAIQGVGGFVNVATDEHELLYRVFAYAPPVTHKNNDQNHGRFAGAARMLDFPNDAELIPAEFVPAKLASYCTWNWKMREAFEYAGSLVDEIAEPGFFEEMLAGLMDDMQLNVREEFVRHLGDRVVLVTDSVLPVSTNSGRFLAIIETTDAQAMSAGIGKAMQNDVFAQRVQIGSYELWKIVKEEESSVPGLVVENEAIPGIGDSEYETEEDAGFLIPDGGAVGVVKGYLVASSHVEFIEEFIERVDGSEKLADASDFQQVNHALTNLGADKLCARTFTRTDEAYRVNYELIRQNQMPDAQTITGKLLNRLLSTEKGVRRTQRINGRKMPDYDVVRRFLGPAGAFVRTESDGWYVAGVLLSKESAAVLVNELPTIETAAVPGNGEHTEN